jgi:origin recognition complex subunit 5
VLILNTSPRPLFLSSAGVPHITFPPYTRKEAITIITASEPPVVDGVSKDTASRIYPQFVSTVYDSLVGPTAGTIPSFRVVCERLWPRFVQPVLTEAPPGDSEDWDFTRLLVRNRAMFKVQGETMLVHRIVPDEAGSNQKSFALLLAPKPPSLPYFPTLVLTSAYVASHTPPRLDTIFFSKFSSSSLSARNKRSHHRRRLKLLSQPRMDDENDDLSTPKKGKRVKTKITKTMLDSAFVKSSATTSAAGSGGAGNALTGPSTILTARPFTLERLIAIYHSIDPNPPANPVRAPTMADSIYAELATLRRLRLVVPSGSANVGGSAATATSADAGEKWCVNISGDWIGELAKGIGVEVGEWLAGGLD